MEIAKKYLNLHVIITDVGDIDDDDVAVGDQVTFLIRKSTINEYGYLVRQHVNTCHDNINTFLFFLLFQFYLLTLDVIVDLFERNF